MFIPHPRRKNILNPWHMLYHSASRLQGFFYCRGDFPCSRIAPLSRSTRILLTDVDGVGGPCLNARKKVGGVTMVTPVRAVHYLNQFFAGIGGEDVANIPPRMQDGPVGSGRALQQSARAGPAA